MHRRLVRNARAGLSPSMIVALVALVIALGGTSYAALQLPANSVGSKQIKRKAVTLSKIAPTARRSLKGQTGARGETGAPGRSSLGLISYGGHVETLNETLGSTGYATPVGFSVSESSTDNFRNILAPSVATTLRALTVRVQNPPTGGSVRSFFLKVGGTRSGGCVVPSGSQSCTVALNMPIPALATIVFESDVSGATANSSDAAFSWQAG